jgi:hypothetical protein
MVSGACSTSADEESWYRRPTEHGGYRKRCVHFVQRKAPPSLPRSPPTTLTPCAHLLLGYRLIQAQVQALAIGYFFGAFGGDLTLLDSHAYDQ